MNKKLDLETYGENEKEDTGIISGVKKIWNKTIFAEKLEQKKEEERFKREVMKEAKLEARNELKETLKEKYKKEELDRMSGKKKKGNVMEKLAKGFDMGTNKTDNKYVNMMGGGESIVSDKKIEKLIGIEKKEEDEEKPKPKKKSNKTKKKKKLNKEENKINNFEDKIKKMLG